MLFFGGLSLPVTQSLLSHLLSINMRCVHVPCLLRLSFTSPISQHPGITNHSTCSRPRARAHTLSPSLCSWTTTAKSVVKSNFFLQVPRIWKRFWFQIVVSVVIIVSRPASVARHHSASTCSDFHWTREL
jgi:hypothetical protein